MLFSYKRGKYDKIVVKMDLWALENLCFSGKLLVDCNLAYFISIWKSDIYIILNELLYELRVKKEWYYDYIANHTNLTDNQNPETVKQMMKENNPHKKGKKKGISKVNVMLA